jgi:secreted trypsin-like serine protease
MKIRHHVILFIVATAYREANGNMTNLPVIDAEHNVTKRDLEGYILGGSPKSMPTAVAIFIKLGDNPIPQPRCSGTILSEDILLSAAHCFFDENGTEVNVDAFIILAGEGDLRHYLMGQPNLVQELNVTEVIIHPYYKYINNIPGEQDELIWDLAILKLNIKMNIETNHRVQAALLPPPGLRHVGKEITVGGWGKYTVEFLASVVHRAIDIQINPDWECADSFDNGEFVPSQMFCAGKRGLTSCTGDSGAGSLIYGGSSKPIILGVLSFGVSDCSKASAFQRVEKSLPWIYKVTKLR